MVQGNRSHNYCNQSGSDTRPSILLELYYRPPCCLPRREPTHTQGERKDRSYHSIVGEGVTKRAASDPFGAFCHHKDRNKTQEKVDHRNNNNNNVHLSCAHQRPERSHYKY